MRDRGVRRGSQHDARSRDGGPHGAHMERGGPSSAPGAGVDAGVRSERVGLNKYTLRFTDASLEHGYQRARWARQRHIWQRSLFMSAVYQVAFHVADVVSGVSDEESHVSGPIRWGLGLMQIVFLGLMTLRLVQPHQRLVLFDSVAYGLVTVMLHMYHRPQLTQWDALYVQYGVAFYTLPKISPLQYLQGLLGSGIIVSAYLWLLVFVRPMPLMELALTVFYLVPSLYLFNHLAYATEKAARERFALRQRLGTANIRVDFSLEEQGSTPEALQQSLGLSGVVPVPRTREQRRVWARAMLAWLLFTVAGWVSIPEPLRFVDQSTALAWMMHVAGFTLFLVMVTRQMRWLPVNFALGLTVLWVMSMVTPRDWAKFAANSVGYVVLAVAIVIAFGALSGVVYMYAELVAFISGVCFSNPSLHQRLAKEHPALLRVIDQQPEADEAAPQAPQVPQAPLPRPTAPPVAAARGGGRGRRGDGARRQPRARDAAGGSGGTTSATSSGATGTQAAGQHCIFCQAAPAVHMLPACEAWGHTPAWVQSRPSRNWSTGAVSGRDDGAEQAPAAAQGWDGGDVVAGDGRSDDGEGSEQAWLPSTVHSADFGTGTVLSTVSAPTMHTGGGSGTHVAPDHGNSGHGGVGSGAGAVPVRPYASKMCTPYASVHQHRTELSLKLRDTLLSLRECQAELAKQRALADAAASSSHRSSDLRSEQLRQAQAQAKAARAEASASIDHMVRAVNEAARESKELRRELAASQAERRRLKAVVQELQARADGAHVQASHVDS